MEEVKVVKVVVNRMPKNCWEDCPLMEETHNDDDFCEILRKSVKGYHLTIHPDCPLTTA